eukprot:1938234-Pleurochrysis_carterae.AAC.3
MLSEQHVQGSRAHQQHSNAVSPPRRRGRQGCPLLPSRRYDAETMPKTLSQVSAHDSQNLRLSAKATYSPLRRWGEWRRDGPTCTS